MSKPEYKELTIPQAAYGLCRCFFGAMVAWARTGCRVVNYHEYWRRRKVCTYCAFSSKRCPVCGCWLWAYCRLASSSCKNWRKPGFIWEFEPTCER